jgi:hypothetical protein
MSTNNINPNQTTDEPMVLTNFFAGGDARRIELSTQSTCTCECSCGCACGCSAVCECFCWLIFNSSSLMTSNSESEAEQVFVGVTGPTYADSYAPRYNGGFATSSES